MLKISYFILDLVWLTEFDLVWLKESQDFHTSEKERKIDIKNLIQIYKNLKGNVLDKVFSK